MESGELDFLCPVVLTIALLYVIFLSLRQVMEEKRTISRGKAYQKAGNLELAIAEYSKIIEEYPFNLCSAEACCHRGRAYQDAGNLDLAIADYTRIIEKYPYHLRLADAYFYRGKAYQDVGDREQAIRDLELYLGLCLPNASDKEEATNRIEQLKAKLAS